MAIPVFRQPVRRCYGDVWSPEVSIQHSTPMVLTTASTTTASRFRESMASNPFWRAACQVAEGAKWQPTPMKLMKQPCWLLVVCLCTSKGMWLQGLSPSETVTIIKKIFYLFWSHRAKHGREKTFIEIVKKKSSLIKRNHNFIPQWAEKVTDIL